MTSKRWLVIICGAALTVALGGCPGGGQGSGQDNDLRTYLGPNGRMYKWQEQVGKAICQLEEKATHAQPWDPDLRICPNGSGGTNDKSTPPSYPPAQ